MDKIYFNSESRPEPTVDFDYDAVDAGLAGSAETPGEMAEIIRRVQSETALRIYQDLCRDGATDKEIGRRALLNFHRMEAGKTHKKLAESLGVSRQRASQLLAKFKGENANVYRDN